jgi:hypothetical protein
MLLFLIECTVVLQAVVGHVKLARLNYKHRNCDLSVQLLDEVQAEWSANLHLKLLTLIKEVSKFTSGMKGVCRYMNEILLDLKLRGDKQNLETLNPRLSTHKTQYKKQTSFCCMLLHMHIANVYQRLVSFSRWEKEQLCHFFYH